MDQTEPLIPGKIHCWCEEKETFINLPLLVHKKTSFNTKYDLDTKHFTDTTQRDAAPFHHPFRVHLKANYLTKTKNV